MKIVITGSNGQLGQDCIQVLEKQHELFPFSSQKLDITRQDQVAVNLDAIKPDVIINCAAYTAVDRCEEEQERCMKVNGEGPGLLAKQCATLNAKLIHISTDYVFNGAKQIPEPYLESEPVSPVSQYGKSKLAGEENVQKETDNHLIIRTAWLYGIEGNNFLKTMLRLAKDDPKRVIKVVNDQYGSLTWTYRLAQQIQHILSTDLTGTIHATSEGYSTWYQGAKYFLETMNVPHLIEPCTSKDYPTPAKRPANSILENSLLKEKELNIMRTWEEDVEEFAMKYSARLQG